MSHECSWISWFSGGMILWKTQLEEAFVRSVLCFPFIGVYRHWEGWESFSGTAGQRKRVKTHFEGPEAKPVSRIRCWVAEDPHKRCQICLPSKSLYTNQQRFCFPLCSIRRQNQRERPQKKRHLRNPADMLSPPRSHSQCHISTYFYSKPAFMIISESSLAVSVLHFSAQGQDGQRAKRKTKEGQDFNREGAHRRHCAREKWFFAVTLTQAQEKQAKEPKPVTKVHMGR